MSGRNVCEPIVEGMQLVGASNFMRVAETLGYKRRVMPSANGFKKTIGSCVSGHCAQATVIRVKRLEYKGCLLPTIVVLLGVNDILRGVSMTKLKSWVRRAAIFLTAARGKRMVLCTVPPFPRLWKRHELRAAVYELNAFIEHDLAAFKNRSKTGGKLEILDLFKVYCNGILPKEELFERQGRGPAGPANETGADDRLEGEPPEPDGSEESLDCGKPANFTYYDSLVGVANRQSHPRVPEPHAALLFRKKGSKSSDLDVDLLERRLKKTKREKPKSVQLYNQLGNFWRIKGNAHKSIECFRRALAVSPHNAEVLLNLARVLFNLQYLDDAIYLTRRSLEVQPPDKSAWQQYFTLGQIFKAYGHQQEAALHLRHALELKPDFEPAAEALKDVSSVADATIHVYTVLIIVCLALGVLLIVLSSVDSALEPDCCEAKTQRHFNRAMAMRSLKLGISPRALRTRRCGGSGGVPAVCG